MNNHYSDGGYSSGFFLDLVFPKKVSYEPEKIIFNPPATIVFWPDGTKTVVKASNGDIFNEEIGFAMALAKKVYGRSHFQKLVKNAERPTAKTPKYKVYRAVYRFDISTVNDGFKSWLKTFPAHPLVVTCEATAIKGAYGFVNMRMDCVVKLSKPEDAVKIGNDCLGKDVPFEYDIITEGY